MKRAAALVVAATVAVWSLMRWVIYDFPQIGDTRVYQHAVRMIDAGLVPYRDFDVEYPPLALAWAWGVVHLPGPPGLMFSLSMCAALAVCAVCALWLARRLDLGRTRTITAVSATILAPILLGTLLQTRYDLLLAAALALMVVAAVARRFGWMWTALAVATALKLVPVLLVPLVFIWHWRHRSPTRAVGGAAAYGAGVAATVVPFFAMAPAATWTLFEYHLRRPLQMESLGSSVIHMLHLPFQQLHSYGSDNIDGRVPQVAATVSTLALVVAVVAIALAVVRATRRDLRPAVFVAAVAATMFAAVVFGKVVSPQYLAWLVPVALLVPGRRGAMAAVGFVAALPVTQLVFPLMYSDLVQRSATLPTVLLFIRNLLLILCLVALWPRSGARQPDGSRKVASTRS
jgi:hypothetical protein